MIIKKLSFKFNKKDQQFFFKDVTAQFTPNKVHFIQGDNGIGKSTFFNLLCGDFSKEAFLDMCIELDEKTYAAQNTKLPVSFYEQIHVVHQNYDSMIANLFTFVENLQLANLPTYPGLRALPHATIYDLITNLGIDYTKPAYLLSGGQRQLLAILMAIQKPTKVLLLDEPTATLDTKNADLVMNCLFKLAELFKITILIICHDKELVKRYAHNKSFTIVRLESGIREIENS